jgi:hypothetical protein
MNNLDPFELDTLVRIAQSNQDFISKDIAGRELHNEMRHILVGNGRKMLLSCPLSDEGVQHILPAPATTGVSTATGAYPPENVSGFSVRFCDPKVEVGCWRC